MRTQAMVHRVEASQRRADKRDWVVKRRERTRHLIELGGLVQKAGLIELTDDEERHDERRDGRRQGDPFRVLLCCRIIATQEKCKDRSAHERDKCCQ